jgi:hypothetical protein
VSRKVKPTAPRSAVEPVIGLQSLAAHFEVSTRTILRWVDSGAMPAPLRRTERTALRWRVATLNEWIEAGCPPVATGTDNETNL